MKACTQNRSYSHNGCSQYNDNWRGKVTNKWEVKTFKGNGMTCILIAHHSFSLISISTAATTVFILTHIIFIFSLTKLIQLSLPFFCTAPSTKLNQERVGFHTPDQVEGLLVSNTLVVYNQMHCGCLRDETEHTVTARTVASFPQC